MAQRLTDFYVPEPNSGCWLFLGHVKRSTGYGVLLRDRKWKLAHRYVFELHRGPIPVGLTLDHLCRVRSCVNPAHLEPVTRGENQRRGKHTKLTWDKVASIRERYGNGETQASLAQEFSVHQSVISETVNLKRWRTS